MSKFGGILRFLTQRRALNLAGSLIGYDVVELSSLVLIDSYHLFSHSVIFNIRSLSTCSVFCTLPLFSLRRNCVLHWSIKTPPHPSISALSNSFVCFVFGRGEGLHMLSCTHVIASHTQGRGSRRMCSRPHEVRLCLFLGTPSHRWYKPFSQTGHRCRTRKVSLSLSLTHTHTTRASAPHTPLTQFFIYGICHID